MMELKRQQMELIPPEARAQRIRRMARRQDLTASKARNNGVWYFADQQHWLQSPEAGLDDIEAIEWLES